MYILDEFKTYSLIVLYKESGFTKLIVLISGIEGLGSVSDLFSLSGVVGFSGLDGLFKLPSLLSRVVGLLDSSILLSLQEDKL